MSDRERQSYVKLFYNCLHITTQQLSLVDYDQIKQEQVEKRKAGKLTDEELARDLRYVDAEFCVPEFR